MHDLTRQIMPPEGHEIDVESAEGHRYHREPLGTYKTCETCAGWLADRADQVAFEFHFTVEDVLKAKAWAEANRYRYDDVEHLLHDALIEKVIHTDKWKAA